MQNFGINFLAKIYGFIELFAEGEYLHFDFCILHFEF